MQKTTQQEAWRGQNNTHAYLKDFLYLRRDWCNVPEGETQVLRIINELKTQTSKFTPDDEKILFIGAGTGRIAFEHNDLFQEVYALDKSFSMVHHFNQLLEKDFSFYEINEFNVMKPEDTARKLTASLQNASPEARLHKDRFEYFVGDAMDLPFEDASLSCITSVYFTDVIALKLYFSELQRALKPGGLFIHFGPLDYFFSDRSEMLTTVEIKEEFANNGFEILHDDSIELPHIATDLRMSWKAYRNWFFIARKKEEGPKGLELEKAYEVNQPVFIEERTKLGEMEPESIELTNKEGVSFEGAGGIIPLLELLDGQSTFNQVIEKMKKEFEFGNEEMEQVKIIFNELLEKGFIRKK